ncbi:EF-hand domain-containing protein [Silanimonas sp.]|jgi:Ca2+-binding EF-hand superfamily protein|uniref:EF-hand domain-containing protein n=1 Tax=Silanimonas sp. TaxID=1929290 RepID=UPI0037C570FF
MSRPLLYALAITLLAASVASAVPVRPEAGATPGGRFAELDRNRDGVIDRGEAATAPRLAERFERIDRNGDQRLAPQELRKAARLAEARRDLAKAQREAMRARFIFLDADGDRSLTLAEIGTDAPRLAGQFATIDRNRDGRIIPDELREHLKAEREARRASRAG